MATMPATLELDKKRGGVGPGLPPRGGGNGGGNHGGDYAPDFQERLKRYRLGVVIGLIGIVMLFVSLTSAYIVRQGASTIDAETGQYSNDWRPIALPVGALALNTLLLLASSVTLELSRRGLKRRYAVAEAVGDDQATGFPWLAVSVVLGFGFLGGQLLVWNQMRAHGIYMSSNPSSSFFYLLTVLHAIHLAGGMVALLYAEGTSLFGRSVARQLMVVDVTGIYWHFMAFLWLYIFALLQFVK
jgi:cytochrome c oxidase subunit 3